MPDLLAPGLAALEVAADLRITVTAPSGETTTARVAGGGTTLYVTAGHPEVLLAAMSPTDAGRAADLLAAAGLVALVSGPQGPVATVGAGMHNRLGKAVTGSARIAPAPRAAIRIAAGTAAARAAVVAALLAVLGWAVSAQAIRVRRRRWSSG